MVLRIYLDAYYTLEPEARSRAGGYFFLVPKSNTTIQSMSPKNGSVHVERGIMRNLWHRPRNHNWDNYLKSARKQYP